MLDLCITKSCKTQLRLQFGENLAIAFKSNLSEPERKECKIAVSTERQVSSMRVWKICVLPGPVCDCCLGVQQLVTFSKLQFDYSPACTGLQALGVVLRLSFCSS